jgi:hypothetical protein
MATFKLLDVQINRFSGKRLTEKYVMVKLNVLFQHVLTHTALISLFMYRILIYFLPIYVIFKFVAKTELMSPFNIYYTILLFN